MEPGCYRLDAVWVDSTIAARASLAIDPSLDTTPPNDATATALSRMLEAADAAERRAALLTYRVTGMSAQHLAQRQSYARSVKPMGKFDVDRKQPQKQSWMVEILLSRRPR